MPSTAPSILLLCASVALNSTTSSDILHGPVTFPESANEYYLLSPCTIDEAEQQADELNGALVAINSNYELSLLIDEFSNWGGIERSFWIGFSDQSTEGDWRWATGEPLTVLSWDIDMPRIDPTRNHAYMQPTGLWRDADGNLDQDEKILLYAVIEVGDADCNLNGIPDAEDVGPGTSEDINDNGIPDECETEDCDADGLPDGVELLRNPWKDCNGDGRLDICTSSESPRTDCNLNGVDDECESPDARGFVATYFTNQSLTTPFTTRIEDSVDFDLGSEEPWPGAGYSDFAARWNAELEITFTGFYTFFVTSDDGVRLFIDGEPVIDDWRPHGVEEVSAGLFLQSGTHQFVLEWFDGGGEAVCKLEWKPAFGERQLMSGDAIRPFLDCDDDGVADGCQIANFPELDCNGNNQLDDCEAIATDCDGNGIYDWCELQDNDCNANGIPDNCEISDGSSDCQPDGIPDECQQGTAVIFEVDDDTPEYGVRSSGTHMCWLQHFVMTEANLRSQAVLVNFNGMGGSPANAGIWLDPNGDGVPDDLELLVGVGSSVQEPDPFQFQRITMPQVDLGPAGASIFIGIVIPNVTESDFPAGLDATSACAFGSWVIGSDNPIDPNDPDDGTIEMARLDTIGPGIWWSNWCLKLETVSEEGDCNFDGIPDECQIDVGLFVDLDGNNIPDVCEDCDGDGIPADCEVTCAGICGEQWDGFCGLETDCNQDGQPDSCQLLDGELVDCNDNGIPDGCEPAELDCNENGLLDSCEFAAGTAIDCNADGVIDSCQLGGHPGYILGTDILNQGVGLTIDAGFWWNVMFEVEAGASIIDQLEVAFGIMPVNSFATIVVWSDPNQDGSPRDAELLYAENVLVTEPNETPGMPVNFTVIDIPPLDIGPTGTRFFVGAFVNDPNALYPAAFNAEGYQARSWYGVANSPDELTSWNVLGNQGFNGEWMIRAYSGGEPIYDCNRNRQPDDCDIADGTSEDLDGDGRPDSCDSICLGDLDGNEIVDGADVGLFLSQWNLANSEADLNGDARVDGEDFGLLLANWGPCIP
ncbi:MAG: PA14 domain-containing protein [Phycisphaerales bacterium]|nr:PA14 domain-containing protein [Phycisphaerales bacterium]